jgi:EpsI family protein
MNRPVLVLIALVVTAGLARWQTAAVDVAPAAPLDALPFELGAWQGRQAAGYEPDVLAALGVDDYLNRAYYASGGQEANLYVGYYRSQDQSGSIHSPLNCLPGAGWQPEQVERVPFAGGAARQVIIAKGAQRLLVVYWYQTSTRIEGDEYRGRFYAVLDTIRHGRNDAALVRVTVPIGFDADAEARATGEATGLARLVVPQVDRLLFNNAPARIGEFSQVR